ncbi:hypothetical protein PHOSAC3_120221 [Mesotoga infera]|nr:hypothetical protein PHOSAC3_120221 [Mesotoga infera]
MYRTNLEIPFVNRSSAKLLFFIMNPVPINTKKVRIFETIALIKRIINQHNKGQNKERRLDVLRELE